MNLYGFAAGDPVNYSDPFGLCSWSDGFKDCDLADRCLVPQDDTPFWFAFVGLATAGAAGEAEGAIGARMARIRAAGAEGEEAAGIIKNTKRIESATGTAKYRVPDELNSTTLTEVKNVSKLGLSNQIRDYTAASKKRLLQFVIRLRRGAKTSKPLEDFVRDNKIKIEPLDKKK